MIKNLFAYVMNYTYDLSYESSIRWKGGYKGVDIRKHISKLESNSRE